MNHPHTKKLVAVAALVISGVVSHFSAHFNSYYLQVLIFTGINVILAVSLNLINGYTGQFSLGHAGFMAVGAYAASIVTLDIHMAPLELAALGASSATGFAKGWEIVGFATGWLTNHLCIAPFDWCVSTLHGLPSFLVFPSALAMAGLAAAIAGLIVGVPSLRLRGDYLAIVTLGFGEIIRVLIQSADFVGAARGLNDIPSYTTLFSTYAMAIVAIYVIVSLIHSTYGRGFLTVRDDEIAAEAMGVNTTRYKVTAFVIGAFFAGIAGGLYAHTASAINPSSFDFQLSIQIVIMVILGGMGSTAGVAFAAILLTLLLEYLRLAPDQLLTLLGYLPLGLGEKLKWTSDIVRFMAEHRMIVFSLMLIALMLLRPQGLFGGMRAFGGSTTRKVPSPA